MESIFLTQNDYMQEILPHCSFLSCAWLQACYFISSYLSFNLSSLWHFCFILIIHTYWSCITINLGCSLTYISLNPKINETKQNHRYPIFHFLVVYFLISLMDGLLTVESRRSHKAMGFVSVLKVCLLKSRYYQRQQQL